MKKEVLDFVVAKTQELIDAPTCSKRDESVRERVVERGGNGKRSRGDQKIYRGAGSRYHAIDTLNRLAESEGGAKVFGPDKTKEVAQHAKDIKAAGAVYCDCPACVAVEEILKKKEEMLQ